MTDPRELKRRAAEDAVRRVMSGMVLGLGTGSTAAFVVRALGRMLHEGVVADVTGIPTSTRAAELAREVGIPLTTLDEHPRVDLTIDGADEVAPNGDLIKGHGGAMLWEKIVAAASARYVIVVDEGKLVERLGQKFAVPVEVIPFGWKTNLVPMEALGAAPTLRILDGTPYVTDEGNYIIDCAFSGGLRDPQGVDDRLRRLPGVVETGLFLGMNPDVVVGRTAG
ncbi:MAG TPA: ribose 5-phosphate isomerase A [Gemmatimonadales bacterium]|jgi:ribose 5-phosphate isomerase A